MFYYKLMKRKIDTKEKPTEVRIFLNREEVVLLDKVLAEFGGKRSTFVKALTMQKLKKGEAV